MLVRTTSHEMKSKLISQIGNTPLLPLEKMSHGLSCTIYGKAEMFNPSGSIKDRLAKALIEAAERNGTLVPGGVAIEVTSGNTGISVAWICAAKGYKSIIVMSDKNSQEKRDMMKSFGAELILTSHTAKPNDPCCSYKTAERLAHEIPNSIYLDQFNNPANIECHYKTTGPEIWNQTDGQIDCLIAGVGTGGTISGIGRYLKEKNPKIEIIAVDTEGSIFTSYFQTGNVPAAEHYELEGIGGDKLIDAMDFSVVDQFIRISDKEAFLTTRDLAKAEGIFCGGSSGAAIAATRKVLRQRPDLKTPVLILPDSGNRYLSKIYNDQWMTEMGYLE